MNHSSHISRKQNNGQVMILAVVVLSGMILSTTALAAFLTLYHLRSAGDISHSAQAIYAADAGIECELYNKYRAVTKIDCSDPLVLEFTNGASVSTKSDTGDGSIRAVGSRGRAARAFEVSF